MNAGQVGPFLRSTMASGERLTLDDVAEIEAAIRADTPPPCALCSHTYASHLLGVACCDCIGYAAIRAEGLDVDLLHRALQVAFRVSYPVDAQRIAAEYARLATEEKS